MSAIQMAALLMVNGVATPFNFMRTISADTMNYNLRDAAVAAGWNQTDPLNATVTINYGVYVGSSTTSGYGFDTGETFPAGTTLAVVNNGFIVGCGGNGGTVTGSPWYWKGEDGGPAFRAQAAVTVTNNGTIGGGGGGGGGTIPGGLGGGGGAGYAVGIGGDGKFGKGSNGTKTIGGASGGSGAGEGGALGSNGVNGANGTGGAAGKAVVGNANITWAATGTRLGPIT